MNDNREYLKQRAVQEDCATTQGTAKEYNQVDQLVREKEFLTGRIQSLEQEVLSLYRRLYQDKY